MPHHITEFLETCEVFQARLELTDLLEQRVHLNGSNSTRNAFAAGFSHAKFHEVFCEIHRARTAVSDDHAARTHERSELHQRFVIDRCVKVRFWDATTGRAARLHGLEACIVQTRAIGNAAANLEHDLAQGCAHRDFDQAGVVDLSGKRKNFCAFGFFEGYFTFNKQTEQIQETDNQEENQ